MRQLLKILFVCILCFNKHSFGQTQTDTASSIRIIPQATFVVTTHKNTDSATIAKQLNTWKKHQHTLRSKILNTKDNKVLKAGFLQEMYIRSIATVSNDSVFVCIPFNLHSPDCSAPDCFSTDVCFSFKLSNQLIFPKKLPFTEYEHGCIIGRSQKIQSQFQLIEKTEKYIIYYSIKPKRTLVLFSSNKANGTTAFYFVGLNKYRINGQNVNSILEQYNPEDQNSIYPYTSWQLTTSDYKQFIDDTVLKRKN